MDDSLSVLEIIKPWWFFINFKVLCCVFKTYRNM